MGRVVRRRWQSQLDVGLSRRDRQGCEYEAYVPDSLEGRTFRLDGGVAADVADAEAAVRGLNASATALVDTEALARLLLRAESVASSRIEGLEVGGRRLLRAEAARALGEPATDVTAEEVLSNIDAMTWAVDLLASTPSVTVEGILEVHRRLLSGARLAEHAGRIRQEQNWIGGSGYNPCSAAFVPPPAEDVGPLLDDLCAFCNDDGLPSVAQAAIAHAQFETIHPFVDGNGRTGRALIHVVLRRRGLTPRALPPVSLVLATWSQAYIDGLAATRYLGSPDSEAAHEGINRWVGTFSAACRRAVDDAWDFEFLIAELQRRWRESLGQVRAGSSTALLIAALPGAPIVTVTSAAALIGRSFQATNEAVRRLEAVGILTQVAIGRRNRAFEARDMLDAFTSLERRLAGPAGDTRYSSPARPAPRRS
ncbi:MAG: Fic family protein [Egibacteraceae bacterium]